MAGEVYIRQEICIGCGLCVSMVPETFRLNGNGVSEVYDQSGAARERIQQAMDGCPVSCIGWR